MTIMREILALKIQALAALLVLSLITGIVYPVFITVVAQFLFPHQANGSLLVDKQTGRLLGSELLGQEFKSDVYFWGRPSATGPFPYNAGASSGSNLGPTSPIFLHKLKERANHLEAAHGPLPIPADLLMSSASGLDPHISVGAAHYQAGRIARSRRLSLPEICKLIEDCVEPRQFGFLGEERVNIVKLNLALDEKTR